MRRVRQLQQHLVRTWGQPDEDERLVAGINKRPGLVIDLDVQVPDTWRDGKGSPIEHRENAQVLRPVLDEDASQGQLFGNWRIDDQFHRRLTVEWDQLCRPFDIPCRLGRGSERVERDSDADHGGLLERSRWRWHVESP